MAYTLGPVLRLVRSSLDPLTYQTSDILNLQWGYEHVYELVIIWEYSQGHSKGKINTRLSVHQGQVRTVVRRLQE